MTFLSLVLLALASYRVWRLLAIDAVLDPLREKILRRWDSPLLAEFMDCPWCLGAWVSLVWPIAWWLWPHATLLVALPFAISALVGITSRFVDD